MFERENEGRRGLRGKKRVVGLRDKHTPVKEPGRFGEQKLHLPPYGRNRKVRAQQKSRRKAAQMHDLGRIPQQLPKNRPRRPIPALRSRRA